MLREQRPQGLHLTENTICFGFFFNSQSPFSQKIMRLANKQKYMTQSQEKTKTKTKTIPEKEQILDFKPNTLNQLS